MPAPTPADARLLRDDLLEITWSDGQVRLYPTDALRASCPCAQCQPEFQEPIPPDPEAHAGVMLRSLDEVGNYAFRIGFTDGHDLGIYTFAALRRLGYPAEDAPATFEV